ncbi:MAG TPA: hypothetical protein VHK69_01540, partial [Chitinophagaceae bacterium]|nr:hypothetical protein [Chitinophagaceae bacterium]
MIIIGYYLLKVLVCSALFTGYYFLALRNRLFHQWNRFYLLATVTLSLMIPLVKLPFLSPETEVPETAIRLLQAVDAADAYVVELESQSPGLSQDQLLLLGYGAVTLVLLIILLTSLLRLYRIVRAHTIQEVEDIRFIDTDIKGTPFSFFRYL